VAFDGCSGAPKHKKAGGQLGVDGVKADYKRHEAHGGVVGGQVCSGDKQWCSMPGHPDARLR
jgi:hypothetical protein